MTPAPLDPDLDPDAPGPDASDPTAEEAAAGGGGAPPRLRRPAPVHWTRALGVCLLAFAVWLLLFAPTLQRNAQASPPGTRRSVSLAILRPVAALSRDLFVSHLVSVADGLIGKGGGGIVHAHATTLGPRVGAHPAAGGGGGPAMPTAAGAGQRVRNRTTVDSDGTGGTTSTTVPAYLHPSGTDPLRVLICGDSLGLDLGQRLAPDLATTGVVVATTTGVIDTGLVDTAYFNWPRTLQGDLTTYRPDVVVIMMGANDNHDFLGPPDIPYGSAQWFALYAQRVGAFMAEAASQGAKVVWVGQPHMQTPALNTDVTHINAVFQAQAAKNPAVTYLNSDDVLSNAKGQYTTFLTVAGTQTQVRATDGIHLTSTGAQLLAEAVIVTLRTQLHIALPAT